MPHDYWGPVGFLLLIANTIMLILLCLHAV
jgi:hypothetical protein